MGADGDNGSFAWYRAAVDVPVAGGGRIQFRAKDHAVVFVNGRLAVGPTPEADFVAGRNVVSILVSHQGRDKMFGYRGSPAQNDPKGILSDVTIQSNGKNLPISGWRMRGGAGKATVAAGDWMPLGETSGRPTFYRTSFEADPPGPLGSHPILRVTYAGLSRGTMWLNGHALGGYPEKIRVDSLYLPESWLRAGRNELVIFDETGASPSDVRLIVEREASREVVRVSRPVDPETPIVVPAENPSRDLDRLNAGNIARHAAVSASSSAPDASASAATDGDEDTRWAVAKGESTGVLTVDLGKSRPVRMVEIFWDGEQKGYRYVLEGSVDGSVWRKLGDPTSAVPTPPDSPSELSRLNLSGEPVRLLRVSVENNRNVSTSEVRAFE
jgi:hypothetical protein